MATSSPKKKKPRTILSFFSKSHQTRSCRYQFKILTFPLLHRELKIKIKCLQNNRNIQIAPSKASIKKERKFQDRCLKDYSWLEYDKTKIPCHFGCVSNTINKLYWTKQWTNNYTQLYMPNKHHFQEIKAPQALHNTPPLLGAPKVILWDI